MFNIDHWTFLSCRENNGREKSIFASVKETDIRFIWFRRGKYLPMTYDFLLFVRLLSPPFSCSTHSRSIAIIIKSIIFDKRLLYHKYLLLCKYMLTCCIHTHTLCCEKNESIHTHFTRERIFSSYCSFQRNFGLCETEFHKIQWKKGEQETLRWKGIDHKLDLFHMSELRESLLWMIWQCVTEDMQTPNGKSIRLKVASQQKELKRMSERGKVNGT